MVANDSSCASVVTRFYVCMHQLMLIPAAILLTHILGLYSLSLSLSRFLAIRTMMRRTALLVVTAVLCGSAAAILPARTSGTFVHLCWCGVSVSTSSRI